MSCQSKSEGVVMAGDGGRVPDVSEQRAEDEGVYYCGVNATTEVTCDHCPDPDGCIDFANERPSDPASVLAALLAESPEATVSAIEALLMGEEAVQAAEHSLRVSARCCLSDAEAATFALSAACRSLLSKAPKGDG